MKNDGLEESYRKEILRALEYHFPGAKVILFGSRARGSYKPGSDIDLAIDDHGKKISYRELNRARVTMEHLFIALNVDLVDLNKVSQNLKETIIQEGVVWRD